MESDKDISKTHGFTVMKNNERGISLIVVLIIGVVSLIFIAAVFYMLNSATSSTGSEKRYYTALEAARGGAYMVMDEIVHGAPLKCGGSSCSPCNSNIESDSCKITNLPKSQLGDYDISAYLLYKSSTPTYDLYTIRVISQHKDNSKEKAIIDFVYKVE